MLQIRVDKTNDKAIISNLIQYYLYDMSEYYSLTLENNAKFKYEILDEFWQNPYIVYVDNKIAGFSLVLDHCPITKKSPCWFMAELFVLKSFRRKGIGKLFIENILKRHNGLWHIGVIKKNLTAGKFWDRVICNSSKSEQITFDGNDWTLYTFLCDLG